MKNSQTSRIESMFGFINIYQNETTLKNSRTINNLVYLPSLSKYVL